MNLHRGGWLNGGTYELPVTRARKGLAAATTLNPEESPLPTHADRPEVEADGVEEHPILNEEQSCKMREQMQMPICRSTIWSQWTNLSTTLSGGTATDR